MSATSAAPSLPCITILLSTFNGERFLREQLDSFVRQTYENWTLFWRDDGSTDRTASIMRDFTAEIGANRCIEAQGSGAHLGASPSFLRLLVQSGATQAVAFADQDDVWLPEKLQSAADQIGEAGAVPTLYCGRQLLVDEWLQGGRLSAGYGELANFPASLTQNIANGNTLVMNREAASLVASMPQPEGTVHDWWSYIVVTACGGRIIFDDQPQVLYRLHKTNLIGALRPLPSRAVAAMRRGSKIFMTIMRRHVEALGTGPAPLTSQARVDLRLIRAGLDGGAAPRLVALSRARLRRQTLLENILFSYWFLTG